MSQPHLHPVHPVQSYRTHHIFKHASLDKTPDSSFIDSQKFVPFKGQWQATCLQINIYSGRQVQCYGVKTQECVNWHISYLHLSEFVNNLKGVGLHIAEYIKTHCHRCNNNILHELNLWKLGKMNGLLFSHL